jgi:hypothetical protein
MNRRFVKGAVALLLAALGGACALARADDKKPYPPGPHAAPSASASASASALPEKDIAPPASSARGAWDPDFSAPPVPTEASKAPEKSEWAHAPLAPEARVTYERCKVQRIREWYRVSCAAESAMEMITGSIADVTIDCHHESLDEAPFCNEVYAIFPVRRGDRRAFEVFALGRWSPEPDALITVQLIDGDAVPLISVQGIRWGF